MLIGAYPFDGIGEQIEVQIHKVNLCFTKKVGRGPSKDAQALIMALIKEHPHDRLSLRECEMHPWVPLQNGPLQKVAKSIDDSGQIIETLRLPVQPTKDQVDMLKQDLHMWMTRYKCAATIKFSEVCGCLGRHGDANPEHVEKARNELRQLVHFHFPGAAQVDANPRVLEGYPTSGVEATPSADSLAPRWTSANAVAMARTASFRVLSSQLRVDPKHGAGLDLQPELGGMRIDSIYDLPGQPGLRKGDLIFKINEVPLRGDPGSIELVFGQEFQDSVRIAIKRFVRG